MRQYIRANRNPDSSSMVGRAAGAGLVIAAALLTNGCGKSPSPDNSFKITFDDLGGGSPSIQTYLGPSDTAQDRVTSESSYRSGQTIAANCKTEGRTVHSVPNLGERDVTSREWVRLSVVGSYATAVYTRCGETALQTLPNC